MYNLIEKWHAMNLWTNKMVQDAVSKNVLSQEEANKIIGIEPISKKLKNK